MIITIDGPSGTGKSTVAKELAKRLGYHYYNTGALYRALAAWVLKAGWVHPQMQAPTSDFESKLIGVKIQLGSQSSPEAPFEEGQAHYWVQGEDMTAATRDQTLALFVSRLSAWPCVRACLLTIQRELGAKGRAIFDGRDMGTVVFPRADLKIFLIADAAVRARRRHLEMLELSKATGQEVPSQEAIYEQILLRDRQDSERVLSPLKPSDQAYVIDASELSVDQVVAKILSLAPKA